MKKNLYLVSIDNSSRLGTHRDYKLHLHDSPLTKNLPHFNPYNIYITSDEKVEGGDWCIADYVTGFTDLEKNPCNDGSYYLVKANNIVLGNVEHGQQLLFSFNNLTHELRYCKKIILTNDSELIAYGVQYISDEFLEWFVKNPGCENVELSTYHIKGDISGKLHYKIIIPKEESKQETIQLKDGNQPTHQFEEWNAVFELQSQCRKLGFSELEMHSVLSNRFELKNK
jgi:hypothetical protein